jgi:hypothetical protein
MIVGIVEGTYSTFISAFIVIEWTKWRAGKRTTGELKKYGIGAGQHPVTAQVVEEEAEEESVEPVAFVPGQLAMETPSGTAGTSAEPQPAQAVGSAPGTPHVGASPVNTAFPGQTGTRKHKKHKRRHH